MPDTPLESPDPADAELVVYGATWCGHCHRLKGQLERAGLEHVSIDVDEHPAALPLLAAVNDGAWLIPTVVVRGRTALVNPSLAQVTEALATGPLPRDS